MSVTLLLDAGTLACYQQSPEGYTSPRVMPHPKWVFGSDHGLSADATGAPAILLEDSRPQAILKFHRPSSLDYRARHGLPVIGFLIWIPYLGSLFGFLIRVPYLGSSFWFLIWVPYLGSLFGVLIRVPYSGSLFGFLI